MGKPGAVVKAALVLILGRVGEVYKDEEEEEDDDDDDDDGDDEDVAGNDWLDTERAVIC